MAYTGTIVTVEEMQFYAGENVDTTGDIEDNHNTLAKQAEAYLSNLVKYDIVTNWNELSTLYRPLFTEWAARFGAIGLIAFNMGGYTSRIEAEDLINIHIFRMQQIEKILEEASIKSFLNVK